MTWCMSSCGSWLLPDVGCGEILDKASAIGTSAPVTYLTATAYLRALRTNRCSLAGQLDSLFLRLPLRAYDQCGQYIACRK